MEQAIERFKRHIESRYPNSTTAKHYVNDLQQFDQLIHEPPRAVTRKDVDRFVEDQLECGLAATTINRRLAALHEFFEYLADEAEDPEWPNPMNWKRHKVKQGKPLPRDVSEAEIEQLFAQITRPRDSAMFRLMLDIGLRVGEVAALRVGDLQISQDDSLDRLLVQGKGGKERFVWLLQETSSIVQAWLERRPAVAADAMFTTRRKKGFSVRGIQERLTHYCRQAEVKVTPHQLRHTFGRRMAEADMPVTSLAALMGHAQVTTTQVYIAGAGVKLRADYQAAVERLTAERPANGSTPDDDPVDVTERDDVWTLAGVEPASRRNSASSQPAATVDVDLSHYWDGLPDWLTELLEEYILHCQRRWKPSQVYHHTQVRLGTLCRIWCRFLDEDRVSGVTELRRAHVKNFVEARFDSGVSSATVNRDLSDLWAFLGYLEDQEYAVNPSVFRVERPKQGDTIPQFLSETDFQCLEHTLLEATSSEQRDDLLDRAWFYLLSDSGLRRGEVCDLRLGDIDLAERRLTVRLGKGKRDRVVPLSPTLLEALRAYLPVRDEADTDHLLVYDREPVDGQLIWNRLHRYGQRAQVEVSPQRLRHTIATRLLNAGMPITSLQQLLGHEQVQTTLGYARVHNETVQHDYERAQKSLSPATSLADEFFNAPTELTEPQIVTREANCV
ncbi:MAG: tyrosine-type recombinase/integrase [Chloroflexota bacterium]|nr:tyrosine-type recombinase/integrase [Chloroflexota bacterium]